MNLLLIITGSRSGIADEFVAKELDKELKAANHLGHKTSVLHGGAKGVDSAAQQWAETNGLECRHVDAEWKKFGNLAGPLRNRKMVEIGKKARDNGWVVMVHAFPSANSKGTWDMVKASKAESFNVTLHFIGDERDVKDDQGI